MGDGVMAAIEYVKAVPVKAKLTEHRGCLLYTSRVRQLLELAPELRRRQEIKQRDLER